MAVTLHYAPDDGPGGGAGADDDQQDPNPDDQPQGGKPDADDDLVSRDELAKVNREAASYRRQLREVQSKLKEFEDAEKTEIERLKGREETLNQELTKARADARDLRVWILAEKVGIAPAARQDATRLLDWSTIEDPDDATGLEQALRDLVKNRPYLIGPGGTGADGGSGGGVGPGVDMNAAIRRAAGRA